MADQNLFRDISSSFSLEWLTKLTLYEPARNYELLTVFIDLQTFPSLYANSHCLRLGNGTFLAIWLLSVQLLTRSLPTSICEPFTQNAIVKTCSSLRDYEAMGELAKLL